MQLLRDDCVIVAARFLLYLHGFLTSHYRSQSATRHQPYALPQYDSRRSRLVAAAQKDAHFHASFQIAFA